MDLALRSDKEFVRRLTEIVETNLVNDNFGVDELIRQSGLSPILIRQRVKGILGKTLSQFICDIRLKKAFGILQQNNLTASEVSCLVGFGSPSYFTSCFHDYFGFPPGEVQRRTTDTGGSD